VASPPAEPKPEKGRSPARVSTGEAKSAVPKLPDSKAGRGLPASCRSIGAPKVQVPKQQERMKAHEPVQRHPELGEPAGAASQPASAVRGLR